MTKPFLASLFGRRFWIPAYALLALGLVLPLDGGELRPLVPVFVGGILYFTALRVPGGAIPAELGRRGAARRLALITLVKLLIVPLVVFAVTSWIAPERALGLALVAAMPAGLSSVAFTDLYRGNLRLALLVVLVTSALCPVTVPLLLQPLSGAGGVDPAVLASQAGYILALLGVPWLASRVTRRLASEWVERNQRRFGPLAIASLCAMIFAASSVSRPAWTGQGATELTLVLISVTALAALFLAIGVVGSRLLAPPDSIACACNLIYVNHGLAVAFATRFFPDDAAMLLPPILIQIPIVAAIITAGWIFDRRDARAPDVVDVGRS